MVSSSLSPAMAAAYAFLDEFWEHVFSFVDADADRNMILLVCCGWHRIESFCRRRIFVENCYAVCPRAAIARFPMLKSVWIQGKPHFADFDLIPEDWGKWIAAPAESFPLLEELKFKRMVVTGECLVMVAIFIPENPSSLQQNSIYIPMKKTKKARRTGSPFTPASTAT